MSFHRRRQATFAMLLALALTIFAPDHWLAGLASSRARGHTAAQPHAAGGDARHGSREEHERHCHGSAAGCAETTDPGLTGVATLALVLAFQPGARPSLRVPPGRLPPPGRAIAVPVPPPRPPL